ncbi:MAG TPA: S8 family serine peptidase [Thermoanaerobaculia bacterium]|nr:S8 family serine peptidase [Thermoanaerobaculia bacterium]
MVRRWFALAALFPVFAFGADRYVLRYTSSIPVSFKSSLASLDGALVSINDGAGFAVVSDLSDAQAAKLAKDTGATDVLPDVGIRLRLGGLGEETDPHITLAAASSPADALIYSWQWNMRAIGADKAWAAGRLGSRDVTVAVIDTGVSYEHPDLAGLVDLSRSVSFVPSDDADVAALFPGRHPVTDLFFHGTHVAATISSNAHLAAGVTSNVTIIGVKVLSRWGEGTFSGVLAGVLWAADHGADVANLSLGDTFPKDSNGRYVAMIQQAFNYARRKGTLMVVAAGNESRDLDHDGNSFNMYCNAANVVCVSATGPQSADSVTGPFSDVDAFAGYSNYGRSAINVAAPGGTGAARIWAACSKTSLLVPYCQTTDNVLGIGGTSMAAPHVAGLAALIVEDVGHGHPSQVKARLQQSADDLGAPGVDPFYGHGRISVPNALGLK